MKYRICLGLAASLLAMPALADDDDYRCTKYPAAERMSINAVQKNLVNQGYEIHDFEYEDHCYEMEGRDPAGRKLTFYIDAKSGDIVHSKDD